MTCTGFELLVITGVDYRTTCNAVMHFPCWTKEPLETRRPITDTLTKNRCEKPEHTHAQHVIQFPMCSIDIFLTQGSGHTLICSSSMTILIWLKKLFYSDIFPECARPRLLNSAVTLINAPLHLGKFSQKISEHLRYLTFWLCFVTSIGWHVWTFLDETLFESESDKESHSCRLSELRSSFRSSLLTGSARDIQSTKWSFHYLLDKPVSPFVKRFVGHLLGWKIMSIESKFVRGGSMARADMEIKAEDNNSILVAETDQNNF